MRRLITVVVVGAVTALLADPAGVAAKSFKKTVKNPTNQTANDLKVCTTGGTNNTTRAPGFTPPEGYGDGTNCVDWPPGSGSVAPGGSVTISGNIDGKAKIDDKNTYLTYNDAPLIVNPCTCPAQCNKACCSCMWMVDGNNNQRFYLDEAGVHLLTIENHEPVPIVYTNVEVWVYNDNSAGQVDDLDSFDTPSGVKSELVPPLIELAAYQDTTFELEPFAPGTYDLFLADEANMCHPFGGGSMAVGEDPQSVTGVGESPGMARFELDPSYPNPFNPNARISYRLPSDGRVALGIYDVEGRLLVTLVNERQGEGKHTVDWDGRDRKGNVLASGTYFARLEFQGIVRSRTMVLLK